MGAEDVLARTTKAGNLPEDRFGNADDDLRNDSKRFADIRIKLGMK